MTSDYRSFISAKNFKNIWLGLKEFSYFFFSQGGKVLYLSEKGPYRLLRVGNDRVIFLLIKYLFHAAAVDFHSSPFPRENSIFPGRFHGFRLTFIFSGALFGFSPGGLQGIGGPQDRLPDFSDSKRLSNKIKGPFI